VPRRQREELQFLQLAAQRAMPRCRLGPKPLHPAPGLGHVVVVKLFPERQ
jgi:hypothetical protein